MSKYDDKDLVCRMIPHIGHRVVIAGYGKNAKEPWENVALECDNCGVVIFDFNVRRRRDKTYVPEEVI